MRTAFKLLLFGSVLLASSVCSTHALDVSRPSRHDPQEEHDDPEPLHSSQRHSYYFRQLRGQFDRSKEQNKERSLFWENLFGGEIPSPEIFSELSSSSTSSSSSPTFGTKSDQLVGAVVCNNNDNGDSDKPLLPSNINNNDKLPTALAQLYQCFVSGATLADSTVATFQVGLGEMIPVDLVVRPDRTIQELVVEAALYGYETTATFGRIASGRIPLSNLEALTSNVESLLFVKQVWAQTNAGAVTSEGDAAVYADVARASYGVTGAGVKVGVISDSFNCRGGAAADVTSGDLPAGIEVLKEANPCTATDEGRAMMQIIHDVAPGASQAFYTGIFGQADFANGILELANTANCDVIVDDLFAFDEPFFMDGVVAQAVNQVAQQGIAYFSAAYNLGRESYESPFQSSGETGTDGMRHDFDSTPGGTETLPVIQFNGKSEIMLQWDQPYASAGSNSGSQVDLNMQLYSMDRQRPLGILSIDDNSGKDPVEVLSVLGSASARLEVTLKDGNPPSKIKIVLRGASFVTFADRTEFQTSTSFGHANAANGAGIAASNWEQTPRYGSTLPVVRETSSAGGVPILFGSSGNRLASAEIRRQPRVTGPDGGVTTFFGNNDNRFIGTSAAAPHIAAVAALMLQSNPSLSPQQIYNALESSAVDMDDPYTPGFDNGFDYKTGYGFVHAVDALASIGASTDSPIDVGTTPPTQQPGSGGSNIGGVDLLTLEGPLETTGP